MRSSFTVSAAVLGASLCALALQNPLQQVFARIDKTAAGFKGFTADMKRTTHHHLLPMDEPPETGKIVVRRAKAHELQMRLDFDPPEQKRVVIDKTNIEIYYPKTNTIQPVQLGKENKAVMEQFLLLGFGSTSQDLQTGYAVTYGAAETVEGEKTDRIELLPKSDEVKKQVQRIDLWISQASGLAIQQKLFFPGGDFQVVTYTNMKQNANIPDSALKLDAPKSAHREKPLK
jgi:outer membrane lipoprotein-sorting protein